MKTYFLIIAILMLAGSSCKKSEPGNSSNHNNNVLPPKPVDSSSNHVTDIDGNVYTTIKIGTQTWLAQNLNTTHYRDGSPIQLVTSDTAWSNLKTGAYCYYNNDTTYATSYGRLYNWYAINNPVGISPAGWHIATDSEWTVLITYLGGDSIAGGAMKATTLWNAPNTGATNESGFDGVPSGYRHYNGTFDNLGVLGLFWTASSYNATVGLYKTLNYRNSELVPDIIIKTAGFSCRCIKD
jgi:uncharacterized protein (TIGR02145 family)